MSKLMLGAALLAASAGVVAAQGFEMQWYNKEVVIRGDYFKAANVAYTDFSKLLVEQAERLPSESSTKAQYLTTIVNFDVQVAEGHGRYIVWITPRSSQEFPHDLTDEAGATYTIDAKSFTVLERVN